MKSTSLNLLYKMLIAIAVTILAGACAKNAGNPGNNLTGMTSTPATGGDGDTGGIDSSGGDTLKSTKEDVNKALKDIKTKLIFAKKRLSLSLSEYDYNNEKDRNFFEKEFKSDDMLLMIRFISQNKVDFNTEVSKEMRSIDIRAINFENVKFIIKENDYCVGDNQHKAASAKGNIKDGEICLSVPAFMKVAPEALTSQVITLALHEVAHLYGFNEEEAVRIQKFLLINMNAHTPSEESIYRLQNNLESLQVDAINLMSSLVRANSDVEVCNNIGILSRALTEAEYIHSLKNSIKLVPSWFADIFVTGLEIKNAVRYCGVNEKSYSPEADQVEMLQKKNLSKSINFILDGIHLHIQKITYYLDPTVLNEVPTGYNFAVALTQYYGSEISLLGQEKIQGLTPAIDATKNLVCAIRPLSWPKEENSVASPPQFIYGNPEKGQLYAFTNMQFENKNMGEIMVRQAAGNNGLEIAIMLKGISDAKIISGHGYLGGDDKLNEETGVRRRELIPMGILYPGVYDHLELKYLNTLDNENYLIRCEVSKIPYDHTKPIYLKYDYFKK